MAVNVPGLVVLIVFYVVIITIGLVAGWLGRIRRQNHENDGASKAEEAMVAGRNLGLVLGSFTMGATSVGGAFLSGTTESVADWGLAWTVFPVCVLISFTLGSFIFAKPMRERQYLTLLDPLQERYGDVMTGLLLLGAWFAELLWGASILIALGAMLSVVISLDVNISIITSAIVALLYTIFGQMVAVAYTDVMQFSLVVFGMFLCVPFVMTNDNVNNISDTQSVWLGTIEPKVAVQWTDFFIAQCLGGIPWNTYIMRILSAKTVRHAQIVSFAGGVMGLIMAIPPILLGAAGVSANWNNTDYGYDPVEAGESAQLMPLVINYLTPKAVAIIALSSMAAAVMSSLDSIILSSSSMFTHNIYRLALRPRAKEREQQIVQGITMVGVTIISTTLALSVDTIYGIFILSADVVYVILFPQFVCAVFYKYANPYGSFFGYAIGAFLRFSGGEPSLNLDPLIKYPWYDDDYGQLFPFKTMAMLASLVTVIAISYLTRLLFLKGILPAKWDIGGKVLPGDRGIFLVRTGETAPSEKGVLNMDSLGSVSEESLDVQSSSVMLTKF